MGAASVGTRSTALPALRSRGFLALASDERLVEQVRRGNEAAFEVVFERYVPALLAFCRHMLSSREEAEDAVQLAFAAAHSGLLRQPDRAVVLKPWLFAIARNRCLSMLRTPQMPSAELGELPTGGLGEQVEQRAELRQLLSDVRELPHEQRAALLLAEVSDLSHAQVAEVLGCEVARVKALVFRARTALMARRRARETPCVEIQEQLATLTGGSLRRSSLRLHLRDCAACRSYREQVRSQRRMLAVALPVAPSLGLKSSVLATLGLGGASTAGGLAIGLSSVTGAFGGATLAKLAAVAALAGGTAIAVQGGADFSREAHAPEPKPKRPIAQGALPGNRPPGPHGVASESPLTAPPSGDATRGAQRRAPSTTSPVVPGRVEDASNATTPGGQNGAARGNRPPTPPGQARRSADRPVPPGQLNRPPGGTAPPGQAPRDTGGPVSRGRPHPGGASGGNNGNAKPPSQPTAKANPGKGPTAAPQTGSALPAAPATKKHGQKPEP